jgi:small subunit ribosomal protein S2
VTAASADLKPGERKVISDGTEGPVVEIIRRATPQTEEQTEEQAENTDTAETIQAEDTGE